MVMLSSNRCDQASSTASTRDVTPPSHIRRLQSRRALCFTPLSLLHWNQPLPSRIEGKLLEKQQWPVWVILQDMS
ncbi:hypothetical protein Bca4012_090824 [Brassica carinata]|uniref:Uncharacterized protein n=1 Tax=Brassica carinata TaxID=52824 RepID=A0A8X7TM54_BRACI|nr:hypothetical protein Bca52824_085839 [Brassica carinata]